MIRQWRGLVLMTAVILAAWKPGVASAQEPFLGRFQPLPFFLGKPLFPPDPQMDEGSYGSVSFLDSPMPLSHFRIRYDVNRDLTRPSRGEVFWAQPAPNGPGVFLPERRVDWQDADLYLEHACSQRFSWFVQAPYRFLNPEINANQHGFADVQAGFKFAFIMKPSLIVAAQCTGHFPTADARQGLGRDFFAVEPGLLLETWLHDWVVLNAQAEYFLPFDGSDFAGEYVRYGLGLTIGDRKDKQWWVTPIAEVVGWTFISGKEQVVSDLGAVSVRNVREETIVNAYLGARLHLSEHCDFYAGYGRAVTNATWAEEMFRFEFRFAY